MNRHMGDDCIHADTSCRWYYYDPICKKTGKMCYLQVTPCKMYKDTIDYIQEKNDCIGEENERTE